MAVALAAVACVPSASPSPTPEPQVSAPSPTPSATQRAGLRAIVPVRALTADRRWHTVPDGLTREPATYTVEFDGDVTAGAPRLRVEPLGRDVPLVATGGVWRATLDLSGIAPGRYRVGVTELVNGAYVMVSGDTARSELVLSAPEYVVWTLDFEGDAASDEALANTAAIADGLGVPMTIMWNPRAWTTDQVATSRADAMLAWTKGRARTGDEVALHIHAWTDYVRAAGVTPRTAPSWSGRGDGYDVPLTAFTEDETKRLLDHALKLMAEHGLPRPTTFRAGGLFANAANLRAVAAAGFTADTSGAPAGPFGRLPLPWTLAKDAQPYHPSRDDANAAGDLPLLEVPNIAGNTYGYTVTSIRRTASDDIAMLAPVTEVAVQRRVLTLVSHPATIDETERAAIESLLRAFEPYRYDRDAGPLRFVTMSQVAQAFR